MDYKEIARKIREKLGTKLNISSQLKAVSKDQNERYRNADSQEAFVLSLFKANWNPECFTVPTNTAENLYCGDILVKNKNLDKVILGIDVKFSSNETRNEDFYSPPDFASILALSSDSPPSRVHKDLFPKNRLIMTFNQQGEYKFLDPSEVLQALLSGQAKLKASYHRGRAKYSKEELDKVSFFKDKIEVIDGNGQLWPQDFLYFTSQRNLMF